MSGGIFNIISCGVGGQGVVLMSNVIGRASALSGKNAVTGEMHGLSQRSGSVVIHQRIGEDAISPLIPYGEADVILALEPMEALRYLFYIRPEGTVITSTNLIHPPNETEDIVRKIRKGYVKYDDIISTIRGAGAAVVEIDSKAIAHRAGSALTENVVMVGAISAHPDFPLSKEMMIQAVRDTVPARAIEINLKAFEGGYAECHGKMSEADLLHA